MPLQSTAFLGDGDKLRSYISTAYKQNPTTSPPGYNPDIYNGTKVVNDNMEVVAGKNQAHHLSNSQFNPPIKIR